MWAPRRAFWASLCRFVVRCGPQFDTYRPDSQNKFGPFWFNRVDLGDPWGSVAPGWTHQVSSTLCEHGAGCFGTHPYPEVQNLLLTRVGPEITYFWKSKRPRASPKPTGNSGGRSSPPFPVGFGEAGAVWTPIDWRFPARLFNLKYFGPELPGAPGSRLFGIGKAWVRTLRGDGVRLVLFWFEVGSGWFLGALHAS